MWIVETALRRPYTFIVMALLIFLATPYTLFKTPVDILPEIDIPVVSMVWSYNGMAPKEMSQRITANSERSLTTTVDNIEHIEAQTLSGVAVIKIFFHPHANIATAISQIVAIAQAQLRGMPPGATPPLIIKYSASSIPVVQLGLSSSSMSEQSLFDTAMTALRPRLVTIPGAAVPYPYGGKPKVISVDLDAQALLAKGLAPSDIVSAVSAQNLILPSGSMKVGELERPVHLNGSPDSIAGLNDLPIKSQDGATIYLKDVANVRDGFNPQTNIIRQDGERGVLVSVIKNGDASTLDIVKNLKKLLPELAKTLPEVLNIRLLADQSLFVNAAISGVLHEAVIAACLTAVMILLFLGNWRSTAIIAVSIPLSILSALLVLHAIGETINIMTLGGFALAVGILVDDATVTIENIERHLHQDADIHDAILVGAGEIAVPALVSTLCICIVFVPMFFLTGVAKYLFAPMAEAVIFAMIASYILSRTLVPTLILLLMRNSHAQAKSNSWFQRLYHGFDNGFERMRVGYIQLLQAALNHRRLYGGLFLAFCVFSCCLYPVLGRDFFPRVDAGQIRLHMRAPTGTRIEETARLADQVDSEIRKWIPKEELATIIDNIGLPYSGINLSYSNSGTIGTLDAEMLVSLNHDHKATRLYIDRLRQELPKRFPGVEFFFQPADIVTQILNFGLPAAIDVQFSGKDLVANEALASELLKEVRTIPGAVDAHIHQRMDLSSVKVTMDRTRAQQLGVNANNVAQNLLVLLSGSFQTSPAFWLNPVNGVVYSIAIQSPQYRMDSMDKLLQTPIPSNTGQPQLLANLVRVEPAKEPAIISDYNISPVIDVFISVEGRDLGSVAAEVETKMNALKAKLPRGAKVVMRGQVETMKTSFIGLGIGLLVAIVLVYLLIVVNFQSWVDPFIIVTALPAALAGIAWLLFMTGTHLSVPALTGAIMTMGVATANSILLVSFARQRLQEGMDAAAAALDAGATRIRPVLMTALAMIIGMVPMALGLGEGTEQNAPLGIATIGGLLFATVSTLIFVPIVFATVHERIASRRATRES